MSIGDPKRARTPPSQHDRARAVTAVRHTAASGLISRRELEERLEQVYRATSLAAIDNVLAGLPHDPLTGAEVVLAHGVPAPKRTRREPKDRPFWFHSLVWAVLASAFWIVVWFFTGGAFVWVVGAILCSAAAFTYRLAVRHRRVTLGQPLQRRRF